MDEQEMVDFAEGFGPNGENTFASLIGTLKGMQNRGDKEEAMKLGCLCKFKDPEYFEENWSDDGQWVGEVSEWLADDVVLTDVTEQFEEVDVEELDFVN